jgi:hypothetical protein
MLTIHSKSLFFFFTKGKMSKFALIIIQLFSIAFKAIAFRSYRVKDILNSDKSAEYHGYSKDQEDIEVAFLEQQLDHYNPYWNESVRASLRQRYFYSNRYVSKNTSLPVYAFLCVGGEGPALDRSVLVDSVHCSGDMLELASVETTLRRYASTRRTSNDQVNRTKEGDFISCKSDIILKYEPSLHTSTT